LGFKRKLENWLANVLDQRPFFLSRTSKVKV
jgi:hypothetical protein